MREFSDSKIKWHFFRTRVVYSGWFCQQSRYIDTWHCNLPFSNCSHFYCILKRDGSMRKVLSFLLGYARAGFILGTSGGGKFPPKKIPNSPPPFKKKFAEHKNARRDRQIKQTDVLSNKYPYTKHGLFPKHQTRKRTTLHRHLSLHVVFCCDLSILVSHHTYTYIQLNLQSAKIVKNESEALAQSDQAVKAD